MPKDKRKKASSPKSHFKIALGIFIVLISIMIIGRVGQTTYIALFISFILGDFSTVVIVMICVYAVRDLLLDRKTDFHHVYIIGFVFLYIGLSMVCHLGLYEPLGMSNNSIFIDTLSLYSRYFRVYEYSYSCGGGLIIGLLCQCIAFFAGQLGIMLVGLAFVIIGVSYIIDIKMFKVLERKKIINFLVKTYKNVIRYFSNINYPNKDSKIPISILTDTDEGITFNLQGEINKERYEELKEFVKDKHLYCVLEGYLTSYTSTRYNLKLANKSDTVINELSGFFDKKCFFIKQNLDLKIEVSNQFKKLLSLKTLLTPNVLENNVPIALDIDGTCISIDFSKGKIISVTGDYTSGIKTFIRTLISSILIKGYDAKSIYFYDLNLEFQILKNKSINYIKTAFEIEKSLDEIFSEFEKRSETFKYLDCDNIVDANKKIKELNNDMEIIKPVFHIIYVNMQVFNQTLLMKLSYAIKLTCKVGINMILIFRNKNDFLKIDVLNCDILAFYTADVTSSIKIFGSDIACRLQKKGDVLMLNGNTIKHGQTPYISIDDFEKIINLL